jgi:hypothetical protein
MNSIFIKSFLSKVKIGSILFLFFLATCMGGQSNKNDEVFEKEKFEPSAYEKSKAYAEKNPITLFGKDSKDKNTNFDFGSSNVLWRASLKTLDFIPLATLDYSGGIIITDWYSDEKSNKEQIKIQIRFVSTELRSESIQVTSYKKICASNNVCTNAKGNESFNREIKDLIVNNARQIKIEDSKRK